MNRKLTKVEFKLVREFLGFSQSEWAEVLGMSLPHIKKTEHFGATSYDVTDNLDRRVKAKLVEMEINLEELLELVKVQEQLRKR